MHKMFALKILRSRFPPKKLNEMLKNLLLDWMKLDENLSERNFTFFLQKNTRMGKVGVGNKQSQYLR